MLKLRPVVSVCVSVRQSPRPRSQTYATTRSLSRLGRARCGEECSIALLEQRLYVAAQEQPLDETPEWPEGSREGESILHVGAAVDLLEEMLVEVGGERAADLFIRKPVRSIHIKNSDRQPQR